MAEVKRVLLPSDVIPIQYDLTLEPDLERFSFDGEVKITCDVQVATEKVTLHARDLLVAEAKFTADGADDKAMDATAITLKLKNKTVEFEFEEPLPVGKGVLDIKFKGTLNDQMAGFYRSKYTNSKGESKFLATTQFESIDARRAFPCWDEPARKAVFVVTMLYPAHLMAISNMPPSSSETLKDGRRKETFMPTPKMSTYLLAFCVGEFEFISGLSDSGTICRIFACPGNTERCSFALKCCCRALDFYNDFFGIPYPLPKVDMIAIPDFSAGAMENWGLVTYREVALLCDEMTVSAVQKQRICTVITHELAHQWFGNLVTMQWWDSIWLNEGFACWSQTFAANNLFPEWKIWENFVSDDQQRALSLDALRSSHPIQVPIANAEDVDEVFDFISYSKGGSVVRMIYAVLGAEKFQEGLKLYFKKHQYGNTETLDLWQAWSEASGQPVERMMGTWTEQMGFPVLKVLGDPLENGADAADVSVEQSYFVSDGSKQPGDEKKKWVVPVFVGSDRGGESAVFLEPSDGPQKIACGSCGKGASWLKLNFGQHVPVRVLYPPSMLSRLGKNLGSLPVEDRIGLLTDTYWLCKAGSLDPAELVNLLSYFRGEVNEKVWANLTAVLGGLDRAARAGLSPETGAAFLEFASSIVMPAFKLVGWDTQKGDDDNKKQLRSSVMGALAKFCFRDPAVAAEAQRRFKLFCEAPDDASVLSADVRTAVLNITMQSCGSNEVMDQLIAAHNKATDGAVRNNIYQALGHAPTLELKKRALELNLTDFVRSQDKIWIPSFTASVNLEGADAVFEWVKSEYKRIKEVLGGGNALFPRVVSFSGNGFVTADKAMEVEAFWKDSDVYSTISKTLNQTVEAIMSQSKFVDRLRESAVAKPAAWALPS